MSEYWRKRHVDNASHHEWQHRRTPHAFADLPVRFSRAMLGGSNQFAAPAEDSDCTLSGIHARMLVPAFGLDSISSVPSRS